MGRGRNPSAYDIWQLGIWLAQLEEALHLHASWASISNALGALSLFKDLQGLEFIAYEAEEFKNDFGKEYADYEKPIKEGDTYALTLRCREWRGQIEMTLRDWILWCPQAHMDIGKLSKGAKSFLTGEEWQMLAPLEQEGLDEATRCLLFNNFTSAEFMALRTVESLLRRWYEKHTGNVIDDATFGQVLNRLDKEFPEPTRPREISPLYHLKERRNAVAHPEIISSEEEATTTFMLVIRQCKLLKNKLLT